MNTTRDAKIALLEHVAPPRTLFDDVHDLTPTLMLAPWEVPHWSWCAEHVPGDKQPVTGGIAEVRMLVRAIDGAGWPWTVVMNGDNTAWFQVLDTAEAGILEVATQTSIGMLARTRDQDVTTRVMPPECRFWVPRCLTDELFSAEEAAEIGIGFLTGAPRSDVHTVRRIHLGDPKSRN